MPKTEIYICESEYSDKIDDFKDSIIEACSAAICDEGIDGFMNISLSSESDIRALNSEFRDMDKATDVLSFPANELICPISKSGITCDMEVDDGMVFLGDIMICYERACEQASEYGHSLKREICFLALHGTLHLLGYDHMTPEDEEAMYGKQDAILNRLGISR